jgi:hypothetical protein
MKLIIRKLACGAVVGVFVGRGSPEGFAPVQEAWRASLKVRIRAFDFIGFLLSSSAPE